MAADQSCAACGKPLPRDAPEGICPTCLMGLALPGPDGEAALRRRFGDYELLEEIARGGMGVVFKARQISLNRIVAVKMILAGQLASPADVQRFRTEAESAARLQHPNIVAIHEIGQHESQHYFSMDYVRGQNLAEFVAQKPLQPKQAAKYLKTIAEAIHYAHQQGILHRDLKPSNILIDQSDQPRITDFGLAKQMTGDSDLTISGQVLGSPNFMPPEQAASKRGQVGPHSDVYALGAILFYLLTGRPPFAAESITETLQLVINTEPPPPRLLNPISPRDLETVCLKCLEKEPRRRYAGAQELADELDRFLRDEPLLARPVSHAEKLWRWCRRKPAVAIFAAATMILLLAVVIGSPIAAIRISRERTTAQQNAKNEENQRRRAEDMLSQVQLQRADDLLAADDTATALAYLARVLRDHPTNRVAAARLLSVLVQRNFPLPLFEPLKHNGRVTFSEFSADGQRIITSCADGTAQVWDATSGQPLGKPVKDGNRMVVARFGPNGQWIVTVSTNKTARVWDWLTGEPLSPPLAHRDTVNDAVFSPDGRRVLTCCNDKTARLWDAHTGQARLEPLQHSGPVTAARFSRDGQRLVTIADKLGIWDGETGQLVCQPISNTVTTAQFSPDGKRVVTASDLTARVWDAQTGEPLTDPLLSLHMCNDAEFSPDGLEVATASMDDTVRLWDSHLGRQLAELRHSASVAMVRFSPDGQRLVTASSDCTARIWDPHIGQPVAEPLKHTDSVRIAAFSPDGSRVLTTCGDRTVKVWDIQIGKALALRLKHDDAIYKIGLSPDGKRVVTASLDKTARIWDLHTGQLLTRPLRHGHTVVSAQFSRDGGRVVTGSMDGTACIWDSYSGQPLGEPVRGVGAVEFSPEGGRIATLCRDGTARVWDAATGSPLTEPLKHDGFSTSLQFSPDGNWLVTSSSGGTARVWDSHTGQLVASPIRHTYHVWSARFSPDGRRIVTASSDTTARVWDATTGQPLTTPLKHDSIVNCARFSPDGRKLVTASADTTSRIWDASSGQLLTEPLRHDSRVLFADFSADGQRVVTVSRSRAARVWDSGSGQPLCEPLRRDSRDQTDRSLVSRAQGAYYDMAQFSPDGHWLVTVSADNAARIWEMTVAPLPIPRWLPDLAEAVAQRRLSSEGISGAVPLEELFAVKKLILQSPAQDSYTRWAKWFFADRSTRTISPSSAVTVPQYVQRLIQENSSESLREALQLSPTNSLVMGLLAKQVLMQDAANNPRQAAEADWQSQRAVELSPNDPQILQIRAQVLEQIGQKPKP